MKKITGLLLATIFSVASFAETKPSTNLMKSETSVVSPVAGIQGVVVDKETKEALAGVAILCNGEKTYTDFEGRFSLRTSGVADKGTELTVRLISYEDYAVKVVDLKNTSLQIELKQR